MNTKWFTGIIIGAFIILLFVIGFVFGVCAVNPDRASHFNFGYVGEREYLLPRARVAQMAATIDHPEIQELYAKALDTSAIFFRLSERDLAEWTLASFEDSAQRNEMIADYEKKAISAAYTLQGAITVTAR